MKLPYIAVYVNDYLADTTHLDATANGAYWFLLLAYWKRREALPNDEAWLIETTRTTRKQWLAVKERVLRFFVEEDGKLIHGRMEKDISRAKDKAEKAAESAGRRWER